MVHKQSSSLEDQRPIPASPRSTITSFSPSVYFAIPRDLEKGAKPCDIQCLGMISLVSLYAFNARYIQRIDCIQGILLSKRYCEIHPPCSKRTQAPGILKVIVHLRCYMLQCQKSLANLALHLTNQTTLFETYK